MDLQRNGIRTVLLATKLIFTHFSLIIILFRVDLQCRGYINRNENLSIIKPACHLSLPPFNEETFTLRRSSIERSNFVREFLDRNGVESRRKRGTVYFLSSKRVVEFFTRRMPTRFVAGDVEA